MGAVGNHGLEGGRIDVHGGVEARHRIGAERAPAWQRGIPFHALRCAWFGLQILEGGLVWCNHAARAPASMTYADGHAFIHGQCANRGSPILEHVSGLPPDTPIRPMMCKMRSLAVTPGRSSPSTLTAKVFGFALQQALRGKHVADFGGADAEGEGAECAVRAV